MNLFVILRFECIFEKQKLKNIYETDFFCIQSHSVVHNPLPPSSNKHRKSGIHTYNWTLINSVGFPSGNLDLIKMPYLIFCTAHISNYKKGLQLFFLHYHYNIFGSLHNKKGGDNEDFCYNSLCRKNIYNQTLI